MNIDQVLDEVASQTGLTDYGHPSFRDGLEVLADNIGQAHLSQIGELVFDGMVRQSLVNRLKVTDWHRRNPEFSAVEPDVQIVILGLSRSGTTALSHLLAADPANRSLRLWEANDCVPPPAADGYWSDPRYLAARSDDGFVLAINPGFKAIHHDGPEDAVECAVPLAQHFASISLTTCFNVEAYDHWIFGADLTHAYQWHRQVLQVLGSHYPGAWQLKSPVHAYGIDVLAATYPNAVFVQTHRDAARCIASTMSLLASLTGTFTDHDHRRYIARHWPEQLATMLERVEDFRATGGDHRFVDLAYADLVNDPLGCVARIYERIGRTMSTESEAALVDHAATAVQHRYGRHEYSLAEFDLARGPIDERTQRYRTRHQVPTEPA